MPTYQALHDAAAVYNRQFQELTARIYEDGFVSCQEATDGTRYYRSTRPALRRCHRVLRRHIIRLYQHHQRRIRTPEGDEAVNEMLRHYSAVLHEFDKLLNDSQVMLKIFADVLRDCPDVPVETQQEA